MQMLDNPIWHALSTTHSSFTVGNSLAKHYPRDVAPLAALPEQSAEAYKTLAAFIPLGDGAALFLKTEPTPSANWTLLHHASMYQMICNTLPDIAEPGEHRLLTPADVPEMLALTELTEPGPFRERTIELGSYLGVFHSGRLVAMAGERLRLTGFTEISAVCTHPDYRGRGYARRLILAKISHILHRGETPFLHVRANNTPAIQLYKSIGFQTHNALHLAVVTPRKVL
jgi:ribosomal protein S18 acetylase RimI-like enzyme